MDLSSHQTILKHGFGMRGMQERLRILAGKMVTNPAIPHGTIFQITLPVTATLVFV